ncbi:MAG TPA: tRNA pseudouridine(55) synthase TruB [Drouetiella sp.]
MTVQQQQQNRKDKEKPFGFINVHKPKGVTSHDVVNKVRRLVGVKQVGHGGTLDPLAEGVLPIAVGAATRFLRFLPQDKTYVAEILLGQQTTTDDIEGDIIHSSELGAVSGEQIRAVLAKFQGEIDQIPPLYSAIHVDGKRMYELAREGKTDFEVKPRRVTIYSLEVLSVELPIVKARISCSSGTYIRSIARDLGEQLGCYGCLHSLVREQAGLFWLDKSVTLDQIADSKNNLETVVTDPVNIFSETINFHRLDVNDTSAQKIRMGQRIPVIQEMLRTNIASLDLSKPAIIVHNQKMIALCSIMEDYLLKPEVVVADGQISN